jgi:hypothetical protein
MKYRSVNTLIFIVTSVNRIANVSKIDESFLFIANILVAIVTEPTTIAYVAVGPQFHHFGSIEDIHGTDTRRDPCQLVVSYINIGEVPNGIPARRKATSKFVAVRIKLLEPTFTNAGKVFRYCAS